MSADTTLLSDIAGDGWHVVDDDRDDGSESEYRIGLRADAARQLAERWNAACQRFAADCETAGYAGWDPRLFLRPATGGAELPEWLDGVAERRGGWLPGRLAGLRAEVMADQFSRWALVEKAQRLGMHKQAAILRAPAPDRGHDRHYWREAEARVIAAVDPMATPARAPDPRWAALANLTR